MDIDSTKIKALIALYRETNAEEEFQNIVKELDVYIYYFPKWNYKCCADLCSEYYLFVQSQMKNIIQSYPLDSQVQFKTWFNHVLLNKYHDFCKQGAVDAETELLFENVEAQDSHDADFSQKLKLATDNLEPYEACLLKFYYNPMQVTSDDLTILEEHTSCMMVQLINIYKELLTFNELRCQYRERQESYIDKINIKIAHFENIIKKNKRNDAERHCQLLSKIERLNNRKSKIIKQIQRSEKNMFKIFVKLFPNYDAAYRMLKYLKSKIRYIMLKARGKQ